MTDLRKKVSRIPAYAIGKLNSFELLKTASKFEKFDIETLKIQAAQIGLPQSQVEELIELFDSFENTPQSTGWHKASATVR